MKNVSFGSSGAKKRYLSTVVNLFFSSNGCSVASTASIVPDFVVCSMTVGTTASSFAIRIAAMFSLHISYDISWIFSGENKITPNPLAPAAPGPVLVPPLLPVGPAEAAAEAAAALLPVEKLEALLVKITRSSPESILHAWGSVLGMLVTKVGSEESHVVVISSVVDPSVLKASFPLCHENVSLIGVLNVKLTSLLPNFSEIETATLDIDTVSSVGRMRLPSQLVPDIVVPAGIVMAVCTSVFKAVITSSVPTVACFLPATSSKIFE